MKCTHGTLAFPLPGQVRGKPSAEDCEEGVLDRWVVFLSYKLILPDAFMATWLLASENCIPIV